MPCRFLRAPVGRRDGRGTQNLRLREKVDDISLGQLSSMTGIAKPHVSRAVNDLIAAGVVRRSAGTFGNSLSINKRYKQWALGGAGHVVTESVTQGLPKEQPGLPEQQPLDGVTETATSVTDSVTAAGVTDLVTGVTDSVRVTDSVTQGLPIRQPQRKLYKRKKTPPIPQGEDVDPEGFPEAWAAYPKRQGGNPRATAVRAWRARLRAGITAAEMVAGTKRYAEHCRAEGKVGTTFVLMAATFFGPDLRFRTFRNLRLTRARSSLQLARRLTSTPTRRGWLKPATQRSGRPSATVAPSTPTGCTATANAFRRGRMNAGELARAMAAAASTLVPHLLPKARRPAQSGRWAACRARPGHRCLCA